MAFAEETFFGITLTEAHPEYIWNPYLKMEPPKGIYDVPLRDAIGGDDTARCIRQQSGTKLVLRQFTLDHYAADDEYHIVEVETFSDVALRKPVKVQILNFEAEGDNKKFPNKRQVATNIVFPRPPVIIRMDRGRGPLHIVGVQKFMKP